MQPRPSRRTPPRAEDARLLPHADGLLTYEKYRDASFTATSPAGPYLSTADIGTIVHSALTGKGGENTRIRDVALQLTLASSGARG